ncbi:SDR family oxidoreductase [Puniceibacterium sediminis]|uniref:NAD(P)-dependent dehydrogenase, short-chain alcohol dehydrogenase family n=1 Tax=Puniceibacterium sediminis TaxID=1608407 RepID=A0A238WND7_9RHOB|nr:SDR family oxidoreductase [Puniceibacterium sediminis]SNR48066.1 NAD(P)-dependent dehydrogenase, short-chain alcohol dehydrogenase family [Puniceibacterium sediminis]
MKALVTGAGKRLGRAMALFLAERGHDVAVHYATSSEAADEVVELIRGMGRQAVALQADLTYEDAVQRLVPRSVEALGGPLTCLVNNASIFEYDNIRMATREGWDRHLESNLRAPFVLIQALAAQVPDPVMDEMDEPVAQGLVVNMIDQRVRKLTPEFMTYTLAKAGLWTLTQTAAQALAPRVRVNGIGPGPTLRGGRQSEDHFARQRAATVLKRGSNTSDIVGALSYFLDSPSVTGQLLCTDGGQHLAWQTPDVLGVE